MNSERIWTLIARKLTGEATVGELEELQELLKENPEIHYSLEVFDQLWREIPYGGQWPVRTYTRLVERMEQQGIEFPAGDRKALYEKGEDESRANNKKRKRFRLFSASFKTTWRNLFGNNNYRF